MARAGRSAVYGVRVPVPNAERGGTCRARAILDLMSCATGEAAGRTPTPMSNLELARALGISQSYVSHLRKGRRMPSASVLVSLVFTLGVDARELLDAYRGGPGRLIAYLDEQIPRTD
jgi:transcriptional regulator with XRE-family HTH domain